MNISEANDVNTILDQWLPIGSVVGEQPSADEVLDAAVRLADRAHKALGAGFDGDDVRYAWGVRAADTLADELRGLAVKLRAGGSPAAAAMVDQAANRVER